MSLTLSFVIVTPPNQKPTLNAIKRLVNANGELITFEQIAAETGYHRRTVIRHVKALISAGKISRQRVARRTGSWGYRYIINE